jgi:hypothetical protein
VLRRQRQISWIHFGYGAVIGLLSALPRRKQCSTVDKMIGLGNYGIFSQTSLVEGQGEKHG